MKNIISILAGLVAGVPVTALIGATGQAVNPPRRFVDTNAPDAMQNYIASLPTSAFMFELAAWVLGAFVASALTARLSLKSAPTYVTTGVFLGLCGVKLVLLPQPAWMIPASLILIPATGLLAVRVFARGQA